MRNSLDSEEAKNISDEFTRMDENSIEPERTDTDPVKDEDGCEGCLNLKKIAIMAKKVIKQLKVDNQLAKKHNSDL